MFKGLDKCILLAVLMVGEQTLAEVIDGEELVDPTRPLTVEISAVTEEVLEELRTVIPPGYEVSFIRAGGSSPIAVINGQSVTIGELAGGATVVAIDRNGVTLLTMDDQEMRVGMSTINIKPTLPAC